MRFDEIKFNEDILQGLDSMNFQEMTPVQEHTIPVILEGRDLIGCAQTGTGKTAAYTLPLLDRLMSEGNPENHVKALIVVPTRELAQQIDMQFEGFAYFLPISHTVVYGGGDGRGWDTQKKGMLSGAEIVIATPGRLMAHIQNSGVDLSHVSYLILDEADRMLDMGFHDDIMMIVGQLPKERQTLMFSATLPPKIREMAKQILNDPAEISIAISKPNEAIAQSAYICYENQKMGIIRSLFETPTGNKTIIFSSSKQKVKDLAFSLKRMKLNVAAMHSDLEQEKREEVMLDFKNGKIDLLVATDVVARGIDITDIGLVINYDVPRDPEDYIHRIGRTARASAEGAAMTFVNVEDQGRFHRIEKFIEREIEKAALPEEVGKGPEYNPEAYEHGDRGRGGRSGGRGRGEGNRGERNRGSRDRERNRDKDRRRESASVPQSAEVTEVQAAVSGNAPQAVSEPEQGPAAVATAGTDAGATGGRKPNKRRKKRPAGAGVSGAEGSESRPVPEETGTGESSEAANKGGNRRSGDRSAPNAQEGGNRTEVNRSASGAPKEGGERPAGSGNRRNRGRGRGQRTAQSGNAEGGEARQGGRNTSNSGDGQTRQGGRSSGNPNNSGNNRGKQSAGGRNAASAGSNAGKGPQAHESDRHPYSSGKSSAAPEKKSIWDIFRRKK